MDTIPTVDNNKEEEAAVLLEQQLKRSPTTTSTMVEVVEVKEFDNGGTTTTTSTTTTSETLVLSENRQDSQEQPPQEHKHEPQEQSVHVMEKVLEEVTSVVVVVEPIEKVVAQITSEKQQHHEQHHEQHESVVQNDKMIVEVEQENQKKEENTLETAITETTATTTPATDIMTTTTTESIGEESNNIKEEEKEKEFQFAYSFHVGPKIRADKNKKKPAQRYPSFMSLSALVPSTPSAVPKVKPATKPNLMLKQTHFTRTTSLSSRRAADAQHFTGDIGGNEFFLNLFNGNTTCAKLLKDCYRVASSGTHPTSEIGEDSFEQQQQHHQQQQQIQSIIPIDQNHHHINGVNHHANGTIVNGTSTGDSINNSNGILKVSGSSTFESLITEEEESSSDEEKSYIKSLRERKALEESEKGYNRVLREKIEQANVNRLFFEPNRKKVMTKEQLQHQEFIEQDVMAPHPPPKGFRASECTSDDGPYNTLYYTIHPLRLGKKAASARSAEDFIKQGVVTPSYKKVMPFVQYNIHISRRFNAAYKQGYIEYNQVSNSLSSHHSSVSKRKAHNPPATPYKAPSTPLLHSPPSTPAPTSNTTPNGSLGLSAAHLPSYMWRKVSEMFHTVNWTSEETALFEELIYVYGTDWAEISRIFCGSKSPVQIYRLFNKHQHTDVHMDGDFIEDWRKICFICFTSAAKSATHRGLKKKYTPLNTCVSCERVFHIDCLDPPLAEQAKVAARDEPIQELKTVSPPTPFVLNTPPLNCEDHNQSPSHVAASPRTMMTSPPLMAASPATTSPQSHSKRGSVMQSPSLFQSSLGMQTYTHAPLNIQHAHTCHNHVATVPTMEDGAAKGPDSSIHEGYSAAIGRMLAKEGQRGATTAIHKHFHVLKQLSLVCLGCLTQVGLFEDSPDLDTPEIYDYQDVLAEDITEEDIETEAILSKRFDIALATVGFSVSNMIAEPVVGNTAAITSPTARRKNSSFINSLINTLPTTPPSDISPSITKKRKRKY
eukprot:gene7564-8850_t